MGKVYRAKDTLQKREIALKTLKRLEGNSIFLEFLKSEFKILSSLRHPNLVSVYDFDFVRRSKGLNDVDGLPFWTSDYISGDTFLKATKGVKQNDIIGLIVQLCRALEYIHSRQIIHGDIKPTNILITKSNNESVLKLIDFGLAQHLKKIIPGIRGTFPYISPEGLKGKLTQSSDLYAVGILLFEAVSGVRWNERDKKLKSLPNELHLLVEKLTSNNPEDRYSHANLVIQSINRFLKNPYPLETEKTQKAYFEMLPFIERERELNLLKQGFDNLKENRCSLILVEGNYGVGKTTLIEKLKIYVQSKGGIFCAGKSINDLVGYLPEIAGKEQVDIDQWLKTDMAEDFQSAESENKNALRVQQTANLFLHFAHSSPVVLYFKDWHQTEKIEWQILNASFFVLADRKAPVLFVVESCLPESSSGWKANYHALSANPQVMEVTLKPLSKDAVREVCKKVIGAEKTSLIEDTLWQFAKGNPFYVTEILKHCYDQICQMREQQHVDLKITLPKDLNTLFCERYQQSSMGEKEMLELLSISNQPLSLSELRGLLNVEEKKLEDCAYQLQQRGIIQFNPVEETVFLKTPFFAESIASIMPDDKQLVLHQQIANFLENKQQLNHEVKSIELARHYLLGKLTSKFGYIFKVAEEEEARFAYENALYLYEHALEMVDQNMRDTDRWLSVARLREYNGQLEAAKELYVKIRDKGKKKELYFIDMQAARLLQRLGKGKESVKIYEQLLKTPMNEEQHQKTISHLVGALIQTGEYGKGFKIAEREIRGVKTKKGTSFLSLLRTLALSEYYLGRYEDAINHGKEALNITESLRAQAFVTNDLAIFTFHAGFKKDAREYYEKALAIAEKSNELLLKATVLLNLSAIYQEEGEYEKAFQGYDSAEKIYLQSGRPHELVGVYLNQASLLLLIGGVHEVKAFLKKGLSLAKIYNQRLFINYFQVIKADLMAHRNEFLKALPVYQKANRNFREMGVEREIYFTSLNVAEIYIELKKYNDVEETLKSLEGITQQLDPWLVVTRDMLRGRLCFEKQQFDRAGEIFLNLIKLTQNSKLPEKEIEVSYWLERTLGLKGNYQESGRYIESGKQIVKRLSKNVPEIYRDDYLSHYKRKRILEYTQSKEETMSTINESRRLERLMEINQKLNGERNVQRLLEFIMDSAVELTNAARGFLIMMDKPAKRGIRWENIQVARRMERKEITQSDFEVSSSIVKQVLENGENILTDNAHADPRFQDYNSVHQLQLRSILVVPLKWRDMVKGALYLDNPTTQHVFDKDDVLLTQSLASLAVVAMDNAKLLEQRESEIKEIRKALKRAQEKEQFKYNYDNIIASSDSMTQVLRTLDTITDSTIPVIISGESGTGKELIAKALHYNSTRRSHSFVSENCAAISGNLLESELFGHVKGAFTGADRDKEGLFKYASGGTVFLDEIGDMPLELQSKILRVLQEGEIRPIGNAKTFKVDVRIVCATHHELSSLVKEKRFREDLYYRLNGITISIPPLRDRKDDIPLLVNHFLAKFGYENIEVTAQALALFMEYNWPGNIRELEHAVHNACLFAREGRIVMETLRFKKEFFIPDYAHPVSPRKEIVLEDEATRIRHALKMAHFKKAQAAKLLGVSRSTLYNKIAQYNIKA